MSNRRNFDEQIIVSGQIDPAEVAALAQTASRW